MAETQYIPTSSMLEKKQSFEEPKQERTAPDRKDTTGYRNWITGELYLRQMCGCTVFFVLLGAAMIFSTRCTVMLFGTKNVAEDGVVYDEGTSGRLIVMLIFSSVHFWLRMKWSEDSTTRKPRTWSEILTLFPIMKICILFATSWCFIWIFIIITEVKIELHSSIFDYCTGPYRTFFCLNISKNAVFGFIPIVGVIMHRTCHQVETYRLAIFAPFEISRFYRYLIHVKAALCRIVMNTMKFAGGYTVVYCVLTSQIFLIVRILLTSFSRTSFEVPDISHYDIFVGFGTVLISCCVLNLFWEIEDTIMNVHLNEVPKFEHAAYLVLALRNDKEPLFKCWAVMNLLDISKLQAEDLRSAINKKEMWNQIFDICLTDISAYGISLTSYTTAKDEEDNRKRFKSNTISQFICDFVNNVIYKHITKVSDWYSKLTKREELMKILANSSICRKIAEAVTSVALLVKDDYQVHLPVPHLLDAFVISSDSITEVMSLPELNADDSDDYRVIRHELLATRQTLHESATTLTICYKHEVDQQISDLTRQSLLNNGYSL